MSKIFVSYRRDDAGGYAHAICSQLVHDFSKDRVFMDVDTIEPGVDFVGVIEKAVGECDVLLALIGKGWAGVGNDGKSRLDDPGDFVRLEISTALARDIRVIPVLLGGMTMPSRETMPDPLKPLSRRNAIEISHTRFNYDIELLITVIRKVLDAAEARRKVQEERSRLREETNPAQQEAERRRLEAEAQRKAEEERFREERKRAEEEVKLKAEKEKYRKRAQQQAERRRFTNRDKRYFYAGGVLVIAILTAVIALSIRSPREAPVSLPISPTASQGDFDGALKDYDEAIRLKPDYADTYINRGLARKAKGDIDARGKMKKRRAASSKCPSFEAEFDSSIELNGAPVQSTGSQ
jgi:tetratricopeptide (TPR) repeat protein